MPQQHYKIVISGGGTGGHIFPAIAIAEALKERLTDVEFLFIGAKGRMEMDKVPAAGFKIEGLWISGLSRKLTASNLLFPIKLVVSIFKAKKILKRFSPNAVIGVGGFASGPTLLAAARLGIPTLIQEQNAWPGITNRWLGRSVDKICVANERMGKFFPSHKIVITGNPVRKEVVEIDGKRNRAASFFQLDPDKTTVLVIGGSQGAMSINRAIRGMLDYFPENEIQLIWQTGRHFIQEASSSLKPQHADYIIPVEFIREMDLAYAIGDIIISRAGAIAIAEICAVAKPAIFIPLPTAAEDHQTKNAMALVRKNAAFIIPDEVAGNQLEQELDRLVKNPAMQEEMSRTLHTMANTDADDRIANEVINLINQHNYGDQ